jgi:pyrroloquinoline quinone biosynthesis protein D
VSEDDALIGEGSVPRFPRGVRLQYNAQRQQWMVQAPERVFVPDEIALAVLQRVDGETSIAAIVDRLARDYAAPREVIRDDVLELLRDLAGKGVIAL